MLLGDGARQQRWGLHVFTRAAEGRSLDSLYSIQCWA